jgi:hypothetical protein
MTKKRAKKKKPYFADQEENAVVEYIITDSVERKHQLYNTVLSEPFRMMTETILRRYPTHIGNYDIHEVEANALTHLIEHMIKYRPFIIEYRKKGDYTEITVDENGNKIGKWEKSKVYKYLIREDAEVKLAELQSIESDFEYRIFEARSFSYCQTIVRNYYKDHGKKSYNEKLSNLSWEDHSSDIMEQKEYLYEIDNEEKSDLEELIEIAIVSIRDRIDEDGTLKMNEVIVGEAIIDVLSNWHILFLEETPDGKFNKKITNKYQKNKILNFLKEQTRLNTKEIRMSMKPFKEIYFIEREEFFKEEDE